MSKVARKRVSRCGVNPFGDLVCPACGVTILTPSGRVLQEGEGSCPKCGTGFTLAPDEAAEANQRAEQFRNRVTIELLRI